MNVIKKQSLQTRNSSIELLRIIALMGVILLHYNNREAGGGFKYVTDGSINQCYLYLIENMFVCAVDLFIMISAFYLSTTKKRKIIKVVELNLQVIVFRVAGYLISVLIDGEQISLKAIIGNMLPVNYFVILYSVLYILSPYINVLLEKISKQDFKKLVLWLIGLFSIWTSLVDLLENIVGHTFDGLSTVGAYGSQYGYSIVNFVLLYFIGAYIRVNKIQLKKRTAAILILVLLCVMFFVSLLEHKIGLAESVWNYNNPLVIVMAALVLLLFMNFNYCNRGINELAKGAFTCFLFHGYFIGKVHIADFVNQPLYSLILHQVIVAVGLYLLSYVAYKIYHFCSGWFIKWISPAFGKFDISL